MALTEGSDSLCKSRDNFTDYQQTTCIVCCTTHVVPCAVSGHVIVRSQI